VAQKFNPNVKLEARHANIKDPEFNLAFFKGFDIVFNALDNLGITPQARPGERLLTVDARRHVNKMCLAADVPLIESGTTGFQGQVQPIVKVFGFLWDFYAYGRGNQNATIAMRRKFRNRFLCVLFDRLPHSLSTASYGPNHTSLLNFLASTKMKSLK
jgi:hypothetical protein